MKYLKSILVVTVLLMGSTLTYASNFADTYGFSAQGIALGNAMTARVNDWSSVYYNIAGLGRTVQQKNTSGIIADAEDEKAGSKKKNTATEVSSPDQHTYINELSVTYMRTFPSLSLNINRTHPDTGVSLSTPGADIDPYGFAVLGMAIDLNLIYKMPAFISSARLGLGMGLNDDMSVAKLNDIDPTAHDFMRYGRECQKAVILAGMGFGFMNDLFGIGAGANVSFSGKGAVLLDNVELTSDPSTPYGQSKMDLKAAPAIVAGFYVSPGQLIPMLKGLDFGVSYRQESYMEIYPFATKAVALKSVKMAMTVAILDYYSPDIYTCGVAYTFWGLTLSADAEYHMWSNFKVNAANNMHYADMPKLTDIIVYRGGLEYQVADWLSFMCGAYYQPSFISDKAAAGEYNFLDNDKYVGSAGVKFALPRMLGFGGPVDITIAYQYQYLAKKTVTKDTPTTDNPNYNYGGTDQSVLLGLCLKL